ncbi:MAG: DUF4296 domain-containing protein [Crocinitomicaceae bacterium]
MKGLYVLILVFFIFSACREEKEKTPENLIPQEEFTSLLVDIQLMESYCLDTYVRPDIYNELLQHSIDSLLKVKGRNIQEYETSFDYYAQHPQIMFQIYEKVLEEINTMQVTNNAVENENPKPLK